MPKKSIIKELLKRRIPQIVGSYCIAGATAIFFIDWLINRYNFPDYYVSLCLFGLVAIIPTVCVVSYFHGAPGKDEWTIVEKTIIPINIVFIIISLLVGYKYEIWLYGFQTEQKNFIVHVSSNKEHMDYYYDKGYLDKEIYVLLEAEDSFLNDIQNNVVARLNEEFFGSEIIIESSVNHKMKELFNKVPHIGQVEQTTDPEIKNKLKKEIYNTFDFESENQIIVHIYQVYDKKDQKVRLGYFEMIQNLQNFKDVSFITSKGLYDVKGLIDHIVLKISGEIYSAAIGNMNIGHIVEIIEKNIVKIQYNKDLILKKGMTLVSPAKYYWQKDGLQRRMEDYMLAMDYIDKNPGYLKEDDKNISGLTAEEKKGFYGEESILKKDYTWALRVMSEGGKTNRPGVSIWNHIFYKMQILDINEEVGTLIAKVIYTYPPWVKVRVNDKVYIKGAFGIE